MIGPTEALTAIAVAVIVYIVGSGVWHVTKRFSLGRNHRIVREAEKMRRWR